MAVFVLLQRDQYPSSHMSSNLGPPGFGCQLRVAPQAHAAAAKTIDLMSKPFASGDAELSTVLRVADGDGNADGQSLMPHRHSNKCHSPCCGAREVERRSASTDTATRYTVDKDRASCRSACPVGDGVCSRSCCGGQHSRSKSDETPAGGRNTQHGPYWDRQDSLVEW